MSIPSALRQVEDSRCRLRPYREHLIQRRKQGAAVFCSRQRRVIILVFPVMCFLVEFQWKLEPQSKERSISLHVQEWGWHWWSALQGKTQEVPTSTSDPHCVLPTHSNIWSSVTVTKQAKNPSTERLADVFLLASRPARPGMGEKKLLNWLLHSIFERRGECLNSDFVLVLHSK